MSSQDSGNHRLQNTDGSPNGAGGQRAEIDASAEAPDIEGGFVQDIPEVKFDDKAHRAKTASWLAITFVFILAGALLLHYAAFLTLAIMGREAAMKSLAEIFNVWLPALVGIVSSAATYYFTKEHR